MNYHDWCKSCDKVRYRNNGFLELVCVCGTDAAVPCGHGARPAHANSLSYVIVTHFRQTRLRCKCNDQFKMYRIAGIFRGVIFS